MAQLFPELVSDIVPKTTGSYSLRHLTIRAAVGWSSEIVDMGMYVGIFFSLVQPMQYN